MEKIIDFLGQRAKINCDENCGKAWGMNSRPRVYPELGDTVYGLNETDIYPSREDESKIDVNNYVYLADGELPVAPVHPGTEEGGERKPVNDAQKMNKWCYRECERCNMSELGEWEQPLPVLDFSQRRPNIPDGK